MPARAADFECLLNPFVSLQQGITQRNGSEETLDGIGLFGLQSFSVAERSGTVLHGVFSEFEWKP